MLVHIFKAMKQSHSGHWAKYFSSEKDIYHSRSHNRILDITCLRIVSKHLQSAACKQSSNSFIGNIHSFVDEKEAKHNSSRGRVNSIYRPNMPSNTGVDLYFNEMFPYVDWTMPTGRIGRSTVKNPNDPIRPQVTWVRMISIFQASEIY